MARLTQRDKFGNADIIGVDSMDLQCNLEFDEFNKVTNALNKLAEYEEIGTVEKCREAVERQTVRPPYFWGDGCDSEGKTIYDMYDCPNCGKSYEIEHEEYKHCPECGQAMNL